MLKREIIEQLSSKDTAVDKKLLSRVPIYRVKEDLKYEDSNNTVIPKGAIVINDNDQPWWRIKRIDLPWDECNGNNFGKYYMHARYGVINY